MERFGICIQRPLVCLALIMFLMVDPYVIVAQPPGTASSKLDQEIRSCIQVVDAYINLSEDMTLAQCRGAAFAQAKRQALESAQTYIKTKTKVEDFTVAYDLIWSETEGNVRILEQNDFGVENNSRYHVWIKAEVTYDIKQKTANTNENLLMGKGAPLTVKVWSDKKKYLAGENITIYIQGNRDFFARIVDIAPSGDIVQLLPNDYRKLNLFEAGKIYKIPDGEDKFMLNVSPPYGEDRIVVYASESPLGEIDTQSIGQGLRSYKGNEKDLAAKSRGIEVNPAYPNAFNGTEFFEGNWSLFTED